MSQKDVLHIPIPEAPASPRTGRSGEPEHPHHAPVIRPSEGPAGTPTQSDGPRIIHPQISPNPYPGVGVS
ncbi:conserved uncharacterized protein [Stigmatella aurantiaca DW4/3-1]|uniref:Conserved uncharacterized protein n=1 Tax=Stigmatella aurantiaca (strain DW4/3-1) TaxID=378806 RepID=E3FRH4_STIAD|nr:conserved uncharacterized protein [Stigmatella aurantiaca DW4/3-1]